jgi:predicted short-subunit dehydrogenase-like oxidoreductase (DUF2520 family)
MKIVIIGSGNVASVLGRLIKKAGHDIVQVVSRTAESAETLAAELGSIPCTDKSEVSGEADIYLVAVSDSALSDIDNNCNFGDKLVVHTAGSVSIDVLKNTSLNYGVLYPLQSLRKENPDLQLDIPLLIDGNTPEAIAGIEKFASTISATVVPTTDTERLKLHVAAVFVSNFTNHLYTLAADYCNKEGLNFQMLFPLIIETALRLRDHLPADMQTGPAARKDIITLDKHLRELAVHPKLKNIYLKMSDSIMNYQALTSMEK